MKKSECSYVQNNEMRKGTFVVDAGHRQIQVCRVDTHSEYSMSESGVKLDQFSERPARLEDKNYETLSAQKQHAAQDPDMSKAPIKKFKTTIGQRKLDWTYTLNTPPEEANRSSSNLQNPLMDMLGDGDLSVVESIEQRSQRSSSRSQGMKGP